jgi:hypothetical protein
VQVGRPHFSRCCYLRIDLGSLLGVGPGLGRSHLNSAVELGSSDSNSAPLRLPLCGCSAVARKPPRLPTTCEQCSQLPRHSAHGSFLGILSSPLGELEPPASEITVLSKGSENVVRTLHHQRPKVTVSFLADVQFWFALTGVPTPGTQPEKTSCIPAAAKSVWIIQGQNVRQCDQYPHTFHLLQQGNFGVNFLGDLLDPVIVSRDSLDRSPRSKPMVSLGSLEILFLFVVMVLIFFMAGLLSIAP